MKCEKCGAEIAEGKLYCEKCGYGIQIVPDYNPELEERIAKTLEKIVHEEFGNLKESEKETSSKFQMERKKAIGIFSVIGIAILGLGILMGTHLKHSNSYEYQFTKAVEYAQKNKIEEATEAYEKVLEMDQNSNDVCVTLANIYKQKKQYELAEECLKTAITREPANVENYRKIIEMYEEWGNTQGILSLLENCENEDIKVAFHEYELSDPTVNLEEGTYKDMLTIVLKVDTKETIYYTLDGSKPTLNSPIYKRPITLEEGEYTLRAIAVNTKGMISKELKKKYTVKLEVPSAPSVFPDSGVYQEPNDILVEVPVGSTVYYTMDGSTPDKNSRKYTKPIPMRLGSSVFSCVVYDPNGKVSQITQKEYTLDLNTTYESPEAISAVRNLMINIGEMYDLEGHAIGLQGTFSLNCYEATMVNGKIYLLVTKRLNNADGTVTDYDYKYAVNAADIGEISKAYVNSEGVYRFEAPY
ncbi:MAG: chitobiase/beta-hexosaminidase C-terminal domain-containing protein [Lachnospiraceae bacterium]|nr:chitobiase/beta-hexosaminidase C-terminal domain-containing protein [Lachnospiraceae bacterium]